MEPAGGHHGPLENLSTAKNQRALRESKLPFIYLRRKETWQTPYRFSIALKMISLGQIIKTARRQKSKTLQANILRGKWQWRNIYFPYFINKLSISRELVSVRMLKRGIFTRDTFEYHKTYAIPNRWRAPAPFEFRSVVEGAIQHLSNFEGTPD